MRKKWIENFKRLRNFSNQVGIIKYGDAKHYPVNIINGLMLKSKTQ